jgi:hypothetical protein
MQPVSVSCWIFQIGNLYARRDRTNQAFKEIAGVEEIVPVRSCAHADIAPKETDKVVLSATKRRAHCEPDGQGHRYRVYALNLPSIIHTSRWTILHQHSYQQSTSKGKNNGQALGGARMLRHTRRQMRYARNFLRCLEEGARTTNRLGGCEERKATTKGKRTSCS